MQTRQDLDLDHVARQRPRRRRLKSEQRRRKSPLVWRGEVRQSRDRAELPNRPSRRDRNRGVFRANRPEKRLKR